ncbi:putative glutamine amidotransferase YLR126C [[Candida] anglica]|uniref:Glutamine amidotransferase YLR126C n=1 Tax=[Candida] anglica TaxID=148631 RepID=A0ABP0EKG8_9ASCO
MTKSPYVAIFVCEPPMEGYSETYGDFGDNARELLATSSEDWTSSERTVKYLVSFRGEYDSYKDELEAVHAQIREDVASGLIRGVIMTGSVSDSFNTSIPWIAALDQLIQETLLPHSPAIPLVGICFGHQLLARHLGCKVGRNLPEHGVECGTTTLDINKSELLAIEDSPFDANLLHDRLNIVEFHQDIVYGLPPPASVDSLKTQFVCLGSTSKCAVQGIITSSGPLKVFTVQGHPEFTTPEAHRLLELDLKKKLIDQAQFDKVTYNTKSLNNQGPVLGSAIANFLTTHGKYT